MTTPLTSRRTGSSHGQGDDVRGAHIYDLAAEGVGEDALVRLLEGHVALYDVASQRGVQAPLWRYTERTHLGLLAAAAWQDGHEAYEEVSTDKKKEGAPTTGRCDLVLYLDGVPYFVEAKRFRPVLRCEADVASALTSKLKERLFRARRDARATKNGRWRTRRMSLVFVTPRIQASTPAAEGAIRTEFLAGLHRWTEEHRHVHFRSTWFPSGRQRGETPEFFVDPQQRLIPGMALVGGVHVRGGAAISSEA